MYKQCYHYYHSPRVSRVDGRRQILALPPRHADQYTLWHIVFPRPFLLFPQSFRPLPTRLSSLCSMIFWFHSRLYNIKDDITSCYHMFKISLTILKYGSTLSSVHSRILKRNIVRNPSEIQMLLKNNTAVFSSSILCLFIGELKNVLKIVPSCFIVNANGTLFFQSLQIQITVANYYTLLLFYVLLDNLENIKTCDVSKLHKKSSYSYHNKNTAIILNYESHYF